MVLHMRRIGFTKMVGAGNDFVILDFRRLSFDYRNSLPRLARFICQRKTGIGADGLLILEKSNKADFKMRVFNADGSEAEMCGNGLRCAVLYANKGKKDIKVEVIAWVYEAVITGKDSVRVRMEGPKDLRPNIPVIINNRKVRVNYLDTGVPHAVIFVQGLEEIDVESIGRSVRHHKRFKPRGTNVDFVEVIDDKNIDVRTYERGVEGETLACGTGAVASAIMAKHGRRDSDDGKRTTKCGVNVHTRGGILRVYFKTADGKIKDVYLEGKAKVIYKGQILC